MEAHKVLNATSLHLDSELKGKKWEEEKKEEGIDG